jgi:inosose dehydratase
MTIAGIGTAPVSYGVYGIPTPGTGIDPDLLLESMAAAGYEGAELPPVGYAGPVGSASRLYARYGLAVAGIYIPIHFTVPSQIEIDKGRMEEALDELAAADTGPRLAILADEGSAELLLHPGRGDDPRYALDSGEFQKLTDDVNRLVTGIRERGFDPSFHPHISTYVESPVEIERLLEYTDIDLTFDTGHIALAGGDILDRWTAWRSRINHVHLKDVRFAVMEEAQANQRNDFDTWWANVATPLGEGDLPLRDFVDRLIRDDYHGWIVVEQDRTPVFSIQPLQTAATEQTRNLGWIREIVSPQLVDPTDNTTNRRKDSE